MVLLIQMALGALLLLSTYVIVFLLHGSMLTAGVAGFALAGACWIAYLVWQGRHPEWWAPWDDGLPQTMRMSNAFIPVLMIFVAVLILFPVFSQARRRAVARHERLERRERASSEQNPKHRITPALRNTH